MILLDDIIEVLDLTNGYCGAVLRVVALDGRCVGRTAIDSDRFGDPAMTTDGLGQKLLGGWLVALLSEQKVDRLAVLVDGTV
jgi:hypothetical protein